MIAIATLHLHKIYLILTIYSSMADAVTQVGRWTILRTLPQFREHHIIRLSLKHQFFIRLIKKAS